MSFAFAGGTVDQIHCAVRPHALNSSDSSQLDDRAPTRLWWEIRHCIAFAWNASRKQESVLEKKEVHIWQIRNQNTVSPAPRAKNKLVCDWTIQGFWLWIIWEHSDCIHVSSQGGKVESSNSKTTFTDILLLRFLLCTILKPQQFRRPLLVWA